MNSKKCYFADYGNNTSIIDVFAFFFVLPALAGKTRRDRFVHCCLLCKQVNIWLYIPHALMDFNQSWVIDATWKSIFKTN